MGKWQLKNLAGLFYYEVELLRKASTTMQRDDCSNSFLSWSLPLYSYATVFNSLSPSDQ